MGCCISRSSGPNSPYPEGVTSSSARHINPPPLSLSDSVQNGPYSSTRRRHQDQRALDEHIDKPLRRHEWTSTDRLWTREKLRRERTEFFDTRVTGRREIWQTVRAAVEILQESMPYETCDENSDGLATAQSILSAAEISLPTGNLADGVYDAFGYYYQIPQWVVSDPANLVITTENDVITGGSTPRDGFEQEEDLEGDFNQSDLDGRKHEKGKGVISTVDEVTLRARLSETGRDFDVVMDKSESVCSIIRKLARASSLSPDKKIRLAYMGKMLKESQSLEAQGWQIGHIVNALVFNR